MLSVDVSTAERRVLTTTSSDAFMLTGRRLLSDRFKRRFSVTLMAGSGHESRALLVDESNEPVPPADRR